jgi:hypothetical protein
MQPGQTLVITAEIVKIFNDSVSIKASGTKGDGDTVAVSARLTIGKENLKTMYRVSLKTGGNRPISFVESTSTQLKTGGMRLIEDKNITKLITDYWQLLAQMNQAQTNSFDTWKTSIKNMTYKIFDGTNYIDVKNKIINDNAVLMTYDPIYLKEYNNRLLNLKFDLKNYLVDYFYDRIDSTILALQKEIKLKYNITEKIE